MTNTSILQVHATSLSLSPATPAHPQRTITTFFSPITPTNATSQSRDTQMGPRLGHKKGVTIDRAIAICRARRPQSMDHDLNTLVIDK